MTDLTGLQIFGILCACAAPLSVCLIALISRLNDASAQDEPHPPHLQCGCSACTPSFEDD